MTRFNSEQDLPRKRGEFIVVKKQISVRSVGWGPGWGEADLGLI